MQDNPIILKRKEARIGTGVLGSGDPEEKINEALKAILEEYPPSN